MLNIHVIIILNRSIFHALYKYPVNQIQLRVIPKISQDASSATLSMYFHLSDNMAEPMIYHGKKFTSAAHHWPGSLKMILNLTLICLYLLCELNQIGRLR